MISCIFWAVEKPLKDVSGQSAISFSLIAVAVSVGCFNSEPSGEFSAKHHIDVAKTSARLSATHAMADESLTDYDIIDIAERSYFTQLHPSLTDFDCAVPQVSVDRGTRSIEIKASCGTFEPISERDVADRMSGETTQLLLVQ